MSKNAWLCVDSTMVICGSRLKAWNVLIVMEIDENYRSLCKTKVEF